MASDPTHEAGFSRRECRECQAPVIFVQSSVSRAICVLNAEPDPHGNIVIRDGQAVVLKKGELFEADQGTGETTYLSHYATCTRPEVFRKPKK